MTRNPVPTTIPLIPDEEKAMTKESMDIINGWLLQWAEERRELEKAEEEIIRLRDGWNEAAQKYIEAEGKRVAEATRNGVQILSLEQRIRNLEKLAGMDR